MRSCLKASHATVAGLSVVFAFGIGLHTGSTASAQPEGEAEMDMKATMDMVRQASEPGEHHKLLKPLAGKWDCEMSFTMPDGSAAEGRGSSHNEWILGGRYLKQDFHTRDFMGAPFKGIGHFGYDKDKGHYVFTWIDDWSTGVMVETGHAKDDGKTFVMEGEGTKGPERHVTRIVDDAKYVMEFHMQDPATGEWNQFGEIVYTRSTTRAAQ